VLTLSHKELGEKWRKIGTDLHSALTEYAPIGSAPKDGMPALIDDALPILIKKVANSTRKQCKYCAAQLKEASAAFFPNQVRDGDVVELLDGDAVRQAWANRMLTVLKMVFLRVLDRGRVEANPCVSVKRFVHKPRERLITPKEYAAVYKGCPPWLPCVMDLCYLTGQRIGDVLKIEDGHLRDEGVHFEQQKTGKRLVVDWTRELRAAVDRVQERRVGGANRNQQLGTSYRTPRNRSGAARKAQSGSRQVGDLRRAELKACQGIAGIRLQCAGEYLEPI